MTRATTTILIFSLFLQIGCSSITQVPLPVEVTRSENEIRLLNYFGERLSSTIYLVDSTEIEANWRTLKENKIYYLSISRDDLPFFNA